MYPRLLTNEMYFTAASSFRMFYGSHTLPISLHWHEFYEMTYIISGSGQHVLNGKRSPLEAGTLFLLTPVDFHEVIPDKGSHLELFNVIFSEEMLNNALRERLFLSSEQMTFTFEPGEAMERDFRALWAEYEEREDGFEEVIQATLIRILIRLSRQCLRSLKQQAAMQPDDDGTVIEAALPPMHIAVRKAINYIHYHFRDSVTLADAAAQAQYSPQYFSECFKTVTGISFQTYLGGLRLRFAKSLLHSTDLPVTQIAQTAGFNTLGHFERAFKLKYHLSPRQYRQCQ